MDESDKYFIELLNQLVVIENKKHFQGWKFFCYKDKCYFQYKEETEDKTLYCLRDKTVDILKEVFNMNDEEIKIFILNHVNEKLGIEAKTIYICHGMNDYKKR